jgi:hypothetical protein
MNKREFLVGGGAAGVAAGVGSAALHGLAATRLPRVSAMRRADWAQQLGHDFGIVGAAVGMLRLVALRDAAEHHGLEQFTLVFARRDGARVAAGTHVLTRPGAAPVALYLDAADDASPQPLLAHFSLLA